tara:strand:+ start:3576 stop:5867 length:2292 start_codon:yes stop_codon:yes gene_type:complete
MASRPKIEIKFQAVGAENLRKTIEKLGTAQNRLNKSAGTGAGIQDKLTNSQKKAVTQGALQVRNLRNQKAATDGLNVSFSVLRSKLLLVSFGFTLIAGSIGKALKMYGEQERVITKLNTQLGFNSTNLQEQASALQQITGVGDEVIINAQSMLASFVRNEEAVGKLTEAALNLSAGLGIDLNSASQLLGKTIGSTTNAMSRYGISVTGAANSSDRINKAIQNTNALFGGLAKAAGSQTLGSVERLSASFGDLIETLGKLLVSLGVVNVVDALTKSFSLLGSAVTGAANFIEHYTTAAHGGVVANDELAKSTNKQIMAIKSLTNVEKARDYIANLEEQISAEKKRIEVANATNIAMNQTAFETSKLGDAVEDVTPKLFGIDGAFVDMNSILPELNTNVNKNNQAIINIGGSQEEFNKSLSETVLNIGNEASVFKQNSLQIEDNTGKLGAHLIVRQSQAESTAELVRLMMLLSQAMSQEETLAQKQISQIQNRNIAINNLAVATGDMTKNEAAMLNLNEKHIAVDEMLEKGFINEIQHTETMNKLQLEAINIEQQLREEKMKSATMVIDSIQEVTSVMSSNLEARIQKEIDEEKAKASWDRMNKNQQDARERQINDKYKKERANLFIADKALALSELYINTELAAMKVIGQTGVFGVPMAALVRAQGLVSAGLILAQKPPEYEYGGLVGGRRHSAGGTLIEAEQGEFVMSRAAVDSIGVNTLNAMNQGGAGVTVNVSGNVLTQDFVEGELAESIQEAVRKGVSFA